LSEYAGKEDKRLIVVAIRLALLLLETILAKEAKRRIVLWWKTPRLSLQDRQGITVRTKWQSGIQAGNT